MRFSSTIYFLLLIIIMMMPSCMPDGNQGPGLIVTFVDVIGTYEGECADIDPVTNALVNMESATISVFAKDPNTGGVMASCARFEDYELPVKSTTAAKVIFERNISSDSKITLTYLSASDSIILLNTGMGGRDMIFSGVRK